MSRSATQHASPEATARRSAPSARPPVSPLDLRRQWATGYDLALGIDAPSVHPESLLEPPTRASSGAAQTSPQSELDEYAPILFWASADETVVGLGTFAEHSALGTDRFTELRAWGDTRLARLLVQPDDAEPWIPRVFCGFAFSGSAALSPEWQAFGVAKAVLPRITYVQRRGVSRLYLIVAEHEHHKLDHYLSELQSLRQRLAELRAPDLEVGLAPEQIEHTSAEQWRATIQSALAAIDSQSLSKVVAARYGRLTFPKPLSLARTMSALAQTHADSTRFVFVNGSSAFLGATPERLLRKRGLHLETEALAGTFCHPTPPAQMALQAHLTSEGSKERSEHSPVLEAILHTLTPLCSEIHYAREPELRSLRHMLHLRTAVQAELSAPTHIVDLIERLHPTPAVGGVPAQAAIEWIAKNEQFARGWYAGPIGWFDGAGDGQFDVALRSGIVAGRQALLFAGAGIVRGSVPEREFEETELKFRGLQAALRTVR